MLSSGQLRAATMRCTVRKVAVKNLIARGAFVESAAWTRIQQDIDAAIDAVRWPEDSDRFTIYPESGKKSGEGNGVKPIKSGFILNLKNLGWKPEGRYPYPSAPPDTPERKMGGPAELLQDRSRRYRLPGAFDAHLDLTADGFKAFVVEWETGNISSSHRAMNKMALALKEGLIAGGILVLPTRALYKYLTDRIGNYEELEPYFRVWSDLDVSGYLGVVSVEHDGTSTDVPRIRKGTDGRALI
jgi:hypothetical protein